MSVTERKPKAPLGASLVVLSSFFYASYGIWVKLIGDSLGGYTASALRSILVLFILVPIAIVFRKLEPLRLKQNWKYILGMTLASLIVWGPQYYAILHAGVGISIAINYASIVIGLFVFGWLFGRERFTKDKAFSALLGIVGIGLIFSPTTSNLILLALIAALISGFAISANIVFSKRIHYASTQAAIVSWTASAVANFVMLFALHETLPVSNLGNKWWYLILFAIASAIASWSLTHGVKLIDAGAAGVLGLLEIVFGVLFGVIFFHERPSTIVLMGMILIIIAASIPYFQHYNAQKGTIT